MAGGFLYAGFGFRTTFLVLALIQLAALCAVPFSLRGLGDSEKGKMDMIPAAADKYSDESAMRSSVQLSEPRPWARLSKERAVWVGASIFTLGCSSLRCTHLSTSIYLSECASFTLWMPT